MWKDNLLWMFVVVALKITPSWMSIISLCWGNSQLETPLIVHPKNNFTVFYITICSYLIHTVQLLWCSIAHIHIMFTIILIWNMKCVYKNVNNKFYRLNRLFNKKGFVWYMKSICLGQSEYVCCKIILGRYSGWYVVAILVPRYRILFLLGPFFL